MPIFATSDVSASMRFYQDVLGFEFAWSGPEPLTFGAVSLGPVSIMFLEQPELARQVAGHQHWFNVDDPDALYAQHVERGAKILSPLEDKPWNFREYTVEDPSGYHLRFAGPLAGQAEPSRDFPKDVRIVRRLPSPAEFAAVAEKEFYRDGVPAGVLERSWSGVVALAGEGAIGVVRIMWDAPGWYSIWDVAVAPEWQGRRIGQRLMEEALDCVKEASPGAHVYLFTHKPGFYEKLGFGRERVSMRKA